MHSTISRQLVFKAIPHCPPKLCLPINDSLLLPKYGHSLQPRQRRSITNPPTPAVVEAVRELAAVALKKNLLDTPPGGMLIIPWEAPKLRAILMKDLKEKTRETLWPLGNAKAAKKGHKELFDVLVADASRSRPYWSLQEQQVLYRWLEDTGPCRVIAGHFVDFIWVGGFIWIAYSLSQELFGPR